LLNAFDAYTAIDIATLLHAVTFDKAFDENDAVLLAKDDIVVKVVIAVERLEMLAYRFDVKLLTPAILGLIAFKALEENAAELLVYSTVALRLLNALELLDREINIADAFNNMATTSGLSPAFERACVNRSAT
jgi:hypothetical protein